MIRLHADDRRALVRLYETTAASCVSGSVGAFLYRNGFRGLDLCWAFVIGPLLFSGCLLAVQGVRDWIADAKWRRETARRMAANPLTESRLSVTSKHPLPRTGVDVIRHDDVTISLTMKSPTGIN